MRSLAIILLFSSPLWAVNAKYKSLNDGFGGNLLPHAVLYSTYTQTIAATDAVQYVELNSQGDYHGLTQINKTTYTVINPGCYDFCFSGIVDDTSAAPGKYVEVWLRHNGVPIADSNTRVQIPNNNVEMTVAVCWIEDMAAGDNFSLMTWGSATTVQWVYTAAGTSPDRPATPSIILSVKKVSGIWNGS